MNVDVVLNLRMAIDIGTLEATGVLDGGCVDAKECPFVPRPPLAISRCEVIILQHPNEAKRGIRVA